MALIVPLANVDPSLIEQLLDRAFEPERHRRTAYKVREGMEWLPALSFAALDDEEMLAGTIQCWPVALNTPDSRAVPLVMVGPVAVLPSSQNEGFGKMLMVAALQALDDVSGPAGPLPQVMIGDPDYYERFFGFSAAHTSGWVLPGAWEPARLLCRAANPAVLPEKGILGPWRGAAG